MRRVNLDGNSINLNAELVSETGGTQRTTAPTVAESAARAPTNSSANSIGWIGVHTQNSGNGEVVINVRIDSPAEKAGIQVGDIIFALDGRLIKGKDFESAVAALKPGTQVSVNFARGSSAYEVQLTVVSQK